LSINYGANPSLSNDNMVTISRYNLALYHLSEHVYLMTIRTMMEVLPLPISGGHIVLYDDIVRYAGIETYTAFHEDMGDNDPLKSMLWKQWNEGKNHPLILNPFLFMSYEELSKYQPAGTGNWSYVREYTNL